jgi:hypothetical protein
LQDLNLFEDKREGVKALIAANRSDEGPKVLASLVNQANHEIDQARMQALYKKVFTTKPDSEALKSLPAKITSDAESFVLSLSGSERIPLERDRRMHRGEQLSDADARELILGSMPQKQRMAAMLANPNLLPPEERPKFAAFQAEIANPQPVSISDWKTQRAGSEVSKDIVSEQKVKAFGSAVESSTAHQDSIDSQIYEARKQLFILENPLLRDFPTKQWLAQINSNYEKDILNNEFEAGLKDPSTKLVSPGEAILKSGEHIYSGEAPRTDEQTLSALQREIARKSPARPTTQPTPGPQSSAFEVHSVFHDILYELRRNTQATQSGFDRAYTSNPGLNSNLEGQA